MEIIGLFFALIWILIQIAGAVIGAIFGFIVYAYATAALVIYLAINAVWPLEAYPAALGVIVLGEILATLFGVLILLVARSEGGLRGAF